MSSGFEEEKEEGWGGDMGGVKGQRHGGLLGSRSILKQKRLYVQSRKQKHKGGYQDSKKLEKPTQ